MATLKLGDFASGDTAPVMGIYATDRALKLLQAVKVGSDGQFDLPDRTLAAAHLVLIGPFSEKLTDLDMDSLVKFRASQFREMLKTDPVIEIPKKKWIGWLPIIRCVHGSVRHCFPFPWLVKDILAKASVLDARDLGAEAASGRLGRERFGGETGLSNLALSKSLIPIWPHRCETVCDGLVEVYRRTCCCRPWIIDDPRIPDLIVDLGKIPVFPPIPWPPGPDPDPPPWSELPVFTDGTLDERILNARRDLQTLQSLSKADQVAYIQARPYLFCHRSCGPATKVAQGFIQPDGEFHICWREPWRFLLPFCHDEFSFVVKQVVNGNTIIIYNGPAAGRWYHYGDDSVLTSYHPLAQGCRHNDFPGDGAFVLLQDIGLTPSYNLKTPNSTGWDRVAAPAYNDGLAFPAANAAAAKGQALDRNWGGNLLLRYHFSEAMKGVGAKYYRVSVSASDGNGIPMGPRTYLSAGVTWRKYTLSGGGVINVENVVLGPHAVGGQNNLFEIPFDADADWQSGQYHAVLETTAPGFAAGRYLLTVEVFNNAGKQLRPNGTPDPSPGNTDQAAFTFRRWFQEVGPTAEVPFAALTHMLWWDNRPAVAQIVDLRVNGSESTSECQFLAGAGSSLFSSGYRAYHPDDMFILNHSMWWRRGLGGPTGYLVNANPNNAGKPPGPVGVSGTETFANMLGGHAKCSFSLNLHINVKTFNGIGTLSNLNATDQAAFALEGT